MSERSWTTIDKSKWGDGPWLAEPDKVQWRDAATGLPCLANRNPHSGSWCGYVGVYPGHRWYDVPYNNFDNYAEGPDAKVEVHGGLTYSNRCREGTDESHGICHVAEPGEAKPWWFGFDCAHAFDLSPGYARYLTPNLHMPDEVYRDLAYVKGECARLAAQLAQLAHEDSKMGS